MKRQSNIELCRIVSILLVMLVHSTGKSLGYHVSLEVHQLCAFSVIGVNVFILITGYFSTSPKKTTLLNIAFICFFWWIVKMGFRVGYDVPILKTELFFITISNWFIPSYICLVFLAPFLNLFSKASNRKALGGAILSLLFLEVWFDWLPPNVNLTNDGYSPFSFAIIYLLGRFIRLYGVPFWFKKMSPFIYVGLSILIGFIGFILSTWKLGMTGKWYAYDNPFVVISAVAFFMIFIQMDFQSKIINHLAKSTLAVLLGHMGIFFLYKEQFIYIYNNMVGIQCFVYWILVVLVVFLLCIVVDQLRLLLYKPLEILVKKSSKSNSILDLPVDSQ